MSVAPGLAYCLACSLAFYACLCVCFFVCAFASCCASDDSFLALEEVLRLGRKERVRWVQGPRVASLGRLWVGVRSSHSALSWLCPWACVSGGHDPAWR